MATVIVTKDILDDFIAQIDTEKEYNLRDYKKIITDIYNSKVVKPTKTPKATNPVKPPSDDEESDEDKPKKRGRPANKPKLDKNGNVKEKKAPSAYNIFVREKIKELKLKNAAKTAKELMLDAAKLWKELSKQEQDEFKASIAA